MFIVAQRETFCQRDWGSVAVGVNVELSKTSSKSISTVQPLDPNKGRGAVKEHPDKCPVCPTWDDARPASMHQTGAIHGLGQGADRACHVINSPPDLIYLIKAIPSGEQTSMSAWNQAKEGRWPHCHPPLVCVCVVWCVGGGGNKHSAVTLLSASSWTPLMSLWFPCQAVLMELPAFMLVHILISRNSPAVSVQPQLTSRRLLCWILTTSDPSARNEFWNLKQLPMSSSARSPATTGPVLTQGEDGWRLTSPDRCADEATRSGSPAASGSVPFCGTDCTCFAWHLSHSSSPTANQFMLKWLTVINP